jgi:hypothetical protein
MTKLWKGYSGFFTHQIHMKTGITGFEREIIVKTDCIKRTLNKPRKGEREDGCIRKPV